MEKELFWEMFQDEPWYYVKCVLKRIQRLLFLNFSWFEYRDEIYKGKTSFKEKFMLSLSNWRVALDFFPRTLYMRFFWVMSYGGMFFAFLRKKYFLLFLLIGQ